MPEYRVEVLFEAEGVAVVEADSEAEAILLIEKYGDVSSYTGEPATIGFDCLAAKSVDTNSLYSFRIETVTKISG